MPAAEIRALFTGGWKVALCGSYAGLIQVYMTSRAAGEHTTKDHPDSVGGAILTGLREAANALRLLKGGGADEEPAAAKGKRRKGEEEGEGRGRRGRGRGRRRRGGRSAGRGAAALEDLSASMGHRFGRHAAHDSASPGAAAMSPGAAPQAARMRSERRRGRRGARTSGGAAARRTTAAAAAATKRKRRRAAARRKAAAVRARGRRRSLRAPPALHARSVHQREAAARAMWGLQLLPHASCTRVAPTRSPFLPNAPAARQPRASRQRASLFEDVDARLAIVQSREGAVEVRSA